VTSSILILIFIWLAVSVGKFLLAKKFLDLILYFKAASQALNLNNSANVKPKLQKIYIMYKKEARMVLIDEKN
jgi:hypothetical protein